MAIQASNATLQFPAAKPVPRGVLGCIGQEATPPRYAGAHGQLQLERWVGSSLARFMTKRWSPGPPFSVLSAPRYIRVPPECPGKIGEKREAGAGDVTY